MSYTIDPVEEAYDELKLEEIFLLEEVKDHQVWLDGSFIRVTSLNIDIYPRKYLQYDKEEYLTDFLIYLFIKLGTKEVVYDEDYTSFSAVLHNYNRMYQQYEKVYINELDYLLYQK